MKDGKKLCNKCKKCKKTFPTPSKLRRHKNAKDCLRVKAVDKIERKADRHLKNQKFVCEICQKTYTRKSDLTYHMKKKHIIQPKTSARVSEEI